MTHFLPTKQALRSGFVGACALTLLHESVRRIRPDAPRMDILGMRALEHLLPEPIRNSVDPKQLHTVTLAGDLVTNSLYFSLIGTEAGSPAYIRGACLGLGAGLGAVLLPEPLGLGRGPSRRTPATQVMTVAWYLLGGLAAAAAVNPKAF